MKNLLILLAFITILSCKKKETPAPAPVDNTDYADSLVGTYKGLQIVFQADNNTQIFNDPNGVVTVAKLSKNKVQVTYYYAPYTISPIFNCSKRSDGNIYIAPTFGEYGTGLNAYYLAPSKQLNIYIKDGIPQYYYFQGKKQ